MKNSADKLITALAFVGLHDVFVGETADISLGDGFFLVKPNDFLLSARSEYNMNRLQYKEAEHASRYLVYKFSARPLSRNDQKAVETLQNGLMALQIVKPVQTLGLIFYGTDDGSAAFNLESIQYRAPTDAGEWARMRWFDESFLVKVPPLLAKIKQVMAAQDAEQKNAIFLLQMGLEHNNPLIAGLLFTMGLDAILKGHGRKQFKKRLCTCLGPKTLVFPDWNRPMQPPSYTVEEIAIDLFMLRSTLAHGVDLRKTASDESNPVDLIKKASLTDSSQATSYAMVLSQAACFLLCQVLEKTL
jgi:hypothetical protein